MGRVLLKYESNTPVVQSFSAPFNASGTQANLVSNNGSEHTFCYFINVRAPDLNRSGTQHSCSSDINDRARTAWGFITPRAYPLGSTAEFEVPLGDRRELDVLGFKNPNPSDPCTKSLSIVAGELRYDTLELSKHGSTHDSEWFTTHNDFANKPDVYLFAQSISVFKVDEGENIVQVRAVDWIRHGNHSDSFENHDYPRHYSCSNYQLDLMNPVLPKIYESLASSSASPTIYVGDYQNVYALPYHVACDEDSVLEFLDQDNVSATMSDTCTNGKQAISLSFNVVYLDSYPANNALNIEFKRTKASGRSSSFETTFYVTLAETPPLECPANYLLVPANVANGTEEFCVAKFEMKAVVGGTHGRDLLNASLYYQGQGHFIYTSSVIPAPRHDGTPWTRLNQRQAILSCERINSAWELYAGSYNLDPSQGPFRLISNRQWQAVAENILADQRNIYEEAGLQKIAQGFSSGIQTEQSYSIVTSGSESLSVSSFTLGEGFYFTSPEDEYAAGYRGYSDPSPNPRFRRTHYLSSGEVIWDFAGNVSEMVIFDDEINALDQTSLFDPELIDGDLTPNSASTFNSRLFNFNPLLGFVNVPYAFESLSLSDSSANDFRGYVSRYFRPSNLNIHNLGKIVLPESDSPDSVILRGGQYDTNSTESGIFAARLNNPINSNDTTRGFRCIYDPSRAPVGFDPNSY
jgi:hypothetical protein